MLRFLFTIISFEAIFVLSMVFKTPARNVVVFSLDKIKRGHGPKVAKTVALMVIALLIFYLWNALTTWRRYMHDGNVSPTDQLLMAKYLLEASIMGFFLFVVLLTDRLHYYIRELHMRRKDSTRKHDSKFDEAKAREEQVDTFKDIVRQLGIELDTKGEELETANVKLGNLKKKSQVLLIEYGRLVSQTQKFRNRLVSMDQKLSRKK